MRLPRGEEPLGCFSVDLPPLSRRRVRRRPGPAGPDTTALQNPAFPRVRRLPWPQCRSTPCAPARRGTEPGVWHRGW